MLYGRLSTPARPPQRATIRTPHSVVFQWWNSQPIGCFIIVSICWVTLLYWNAIRVPFVYDDVLGIQQNPALSSWHSVLSYFRAPVPLNNEYRGYAGSIYRPRVWLSYVIDRKLWGLNPSGFHVTNLALHWSNGLLGFLLIRKLGNLADNFCCHVSDMAGSSYRF